MRRVLAVLLPLTFVLACGSDNEEGGGAEYCALSAEVEGSDDLGLAFGFAPDGTAATPEQVEAGTDRFQSLLRDLAEAAPGELTADLERVTEVFDGYAAAVKEADFNVTAVDPSDPRVVRMSAANANNGNELDVADARIKTYNEDICGLGGQE